MLVDSSCARHWPGLRTVARPGAHLGQACPRAAGTGGKWALGTPLGLTPSTGLAAEMFLDLPQHKLRQAESGRGLLGSVVNGDHLTAGDLAGLRRPESHCGAPPVLCQPDVEALATWGPGG